MSWFERFPDRFEYELADFRSRGLAFELDQALLDSESRVALRGALKVEGEADPVDLVVVYPDAFPFFRPEVFAPTLTLTRHQNPFERNLCLLDRSTRAWSPGETAAHLVVSQVPYLLNLLRAGGEELRAAEVPQGEPVSYYFPPLAGTVVWIPDDLLKLDPQHRTGVGRIAFRDGEPAALRVRGLFSAASVRERRGRTKKLAAAGSELQGLFGAGSIEMRWVRLDAAPSSRSPEQLLAQAAEVAPGVEAPWQQVAGGHIAVTGLVYSEEVRQGEVADGWLFVVAFRDRPTASTAATGWYVTRGERLSREDLLTRVPRMSALAEKSVALIGLGALGAPIAVELVRAQVGELRILDFDLVETGTIVRWPYGLSAVAAPKAEFLAHVLPREYPFTRVVPFQRAVGEVLPANVVRPTDEDDFELMERVLIGVDLVIDASAEIGVQQFVSYCADEHRIRQVVVSATEGARGGIVARLVPGVTGCWHCLQRALYQGDIGLPPHDETGTVQPRGCGSRTFTGTSFDLLPIVAQAVKTASATLLEGRSGADVFVCSMPKDDGAPVWTDSLLERHDSCAGCGVAEAA